MLSIRKADPHELENIRTFYHQLTDACQRAHYDIGSVSYTHLTLPTIA